MDVAAVLDPLLHPQLIYRRKTILKNSTKFIGKFQRKILRLTARFIQCFQSYRNQSIDKYCKSIDWFLYDGE